MQKRKWTQQEEEILIRLYEDPKVFPKDIAKMLGRALQQVYNKARAMGLKAPMERIRMAGKIGMHVCNYRCLGCNIQSQLQHDSTRGISQRIRARKSLRKCMKGCGPQCSRRVASTKTKGRLDQSG